MPFRTITARDGSQTATTRVQLPPPPAGLTARVQEAAPAHSGAWTAQIVSDPYADAQFVIDWGDGSAPTTYTDATALQTHQYTDPGSYPVTVTAAPSGAAFTTTITVVIEAQPLQVAATVDESNAQTFTLEVTDPNSGNTSWILDWGDGSDPQTLTALSPAPSHRYTSGGERDITVTGSPAGGAGSTSVTVPAPTVQVQESTSYPAGTGRYTVRIDASGNPGGDDEFTVVWLDEVVGDGRTTVGGTMDLTPVPLSYNDGDQIPITVTGNTSGLTQTQLVTLSLLPRTDRPEEWSMTITTGTPSGSFTPVTVTWDAVTGADRYKVEAWDTDGALSPTFTSLVTETTTTNNVVTAVTYDVYLYALTGVEGTGQTHRLSLPVTGTVTG